MSYTGRKVQAIRELVWNSYPRKCCHCGSTALLFATFTVEHLLPRSKGGSESIENLRPACGSRSSGGCGVNFARGNRQLAGKKPEDGRGFFS